MSEPNAFGQPFHPNKSKWSGSPERKAALEEFLQNSKVIVTDDVDRDHIVRYDGEVFRYSQAYHNAILAFRRRQNKDW
jgi:hypothetical protein